MVFMVVMVIMGNINTARQKLSSMLMDEWVDVKAVLRIITPTKNKLSL